MSLLDWRDVDPSRVEPLYASERQRWHAALHWDLDPSVRIIEGARQAGRLPGFLHTGPHGVADGWAFFVLHDGLLQIGGLTASTASATRELLQAILSSPDARLARAVRCFLYPQSPSLSSALDRQRFTLHRHLYLERTEGDAGAGDGKQASPVPGERGLSEVDLAEVVRLSARAYAGAAEATCFAPDGRLDQWAHYFAQLLNTPGVGWYIPRASFAVCPPGQRRPEAVVVTTAIDTGTAHVAQVIVDPAAQGRGLGRYLVERACEAASLMGYRRMTLLVAEPNSRARALYASLGFRETTAFLYGSRAAVGRRVAEEPSHPNRPV